MSRAILAVLLPLCLLLTACGDRELSGDERGVVGLYVIHYVTEPASGASPQAASGSSQEPSEAQESATVTGDLTAVLSNYPMRLAYLVWLRADRGVEVRSQLFPHVVRSFKLVFGEDPRWRSDSSGVSISDGGSGPSHHLEVRGSEAAGSSGGVRAEVWLERVTSAAPPPPDWSALAQRLVDPGPHAGALSEALTWLRRAYFAQVARIVEADIPTGGAPQGLVPDVLAAAAMRVLDSGSSELERAAAAAILGYADVDEARVRQLLRVASDSGEPSAVRGAAHLAALFSARWIARDEADEPHTVSDLESLHGWSGSSSR